MSRLYLFLTSLLLFACQAEENKTFKPIEKMSFQSGFFSMNTQVESFADREYLCIADFHTQKRIAIHDLRNRDSVLFVPLNEITRLGEKILAFEVHSLDTIMVLPNYSNVLYFINRNGEIWREINLNPHLEKEGYFELTRSATPFQFNDSTLIFSVNFLAKNLPLESRGNLNYFYQRKSEAPALFKIENIFADTLKCEFGLRNLYSNFTSKNSVTIEGSLFSFFEDKIIYNSAYSDSLYIIGSSSLEIESKIAVHSEYTDLRIEPISTIELKNSPQSLNTNFLSNGQIAAVLYDSKKGLYSVIAKHKPIGDGFPWSIIFLDHNLEKVNETLMDESLYYSKAWTSSKGLLISNYYETLADSDHFTKNTFALFQHD